MTTRNSLESTCSCCGHKYALGAGLGPRCVCFTTRMCTTCWRCVAHCACPPSTGGIGRIASALVLILLLAGCAAPARQVETVIQEVPVTVFCDPPAVPSPSLPIDAVAPEANLFEIDRALWASLELLEGLVGRLSASIDACRRPAP